MEGAGLIEESAGAENVKVRVKYEVIAKCLDAGDGGEFAFGLVELKAHGAGYRLEATGWR